jgi:hypothetical protein
VQPKPIPTRFITTQNLYLTIQLKALLGFFNRLLYLIKIPGINGDHPHLSVVAECQLPFVQTQFKCQLHYIFFCAILCSQGSLGLFHLKPPLVFGVYLFFIHQMAAQGTLHSIYPAKKLGWPIFFRFA